VAEVISAAEWRPVLRRRLLVFAAIVALWIAGIQVRLLILQIRDHDALVQVARDQRENKLVEPAKRGDIRDANGRVLAYSADTDTIYAVPAQVDDAEKTAAKLCAALDGCDREMRADLLERLRVKRPFVYLKRRALPAEANRVFHLGLDGIGFMTESKRFYPNRELAAPLLGYVGVDNKGLSGLEALLDRVIRGRDGSLLIQTDAKKRPFSRLEQPPTSGSDVQITIDEHLQYIVERELAAGVAENNAEGGAAVVMDPNSGEIRAMANWPTFNPNIYNAVSADARKNRAVQDLYEPGSTFKIVTASAALEEHLFDPQQTVDVTGGQIRFGNRVIHDTHDYGVLTFTDVLVKSSNVGAIRIGKVVGAERLSLYINRFGFGRQTASGLPGESPGIVWKPQELDESALASVSMGYQVGVTPLQMAMAVSAIANGGTLYTPRILKSVTTNGLRQDFAVNEVHRAIKPETAATLTGIMEQVVDRGTARAARMDGFTVAGKTGTAAKLVNGRYSTTNYNASFVGFVPSRAPVLTIVVVIDSPHSKGHTGGIAAAPVFKRIADASLRYLGVAPTVNPEPPVLVARREESPPIVPVSGPVTPAIATVAASSSTVPDLRGYGVRDAMTYLASLGLTPRLKGAGVVVDQIPAPGAPLEPGATCVLILQRDLRSARGDRP
jgi:cell division protein FtsI (penicillin-binding protein 3)